MSPSYYLVQRNKVETFPSRRGQQNNMLDLSRQNNAGEKEYTSDIFPS